MYTVEIPRSGWKLERITGQGDWRGDLAYPRVVVKQEIEGDKRLSVGLVRTQSGIEISGAVIEEWQEELGIGGYWVEGRSICPSSIELIDA